MSWVATVGEYLLMPADYLTKGFIAAAPIIGGVWDSILNGIVSAWNSFVGTMASGIDFLLRPINDLRIALGGTAISIEELINKTQIKPPKAIVTGILETGANVWESGVAKAKEELAALAKPTDISAVTNRIAELTQQMSDKVAANTKNITDAAKPPPKAFVPPTAAVTKEAKMEVSGVAEFASKLRLAQGAPGPPAKAAHGTSGDPQAGGRERQGAHQAGRGRIRNGSGLAQPE